MLYMVYVTGEPIIHSLSYMHIETVFDVPLYHVRLCTFCEGFFFLAEVSPYASVQRILNMESSGRSKEPHHHIYINTDANSYCRSMESYKSMVTSKRVSKNAWIDCVPQDLASRPTYLPYYHARPRKCMHQRYRRMSAQATQRYQRPIHTHPIIAVAGLV